MSEIFDTEGKLKIPAKELNREELIVKEVYCPEGHNLISKEHKVSDHPGIELAFRKKNGEEGIVVLSPILGDFNAVFLRGKVDDGEVVKFRCPVCDRELPVLSTCNICGEGKIYVLFLDKTFSFNNAITFCSKKGCSNSSIRRSDAIITALGL